MKLTFAEPNDVTEVRGKLSFDANGLVCYGDAMGLPPGIRPMGAFFEEDGTYSLCGQVVESDGAWKLYRARTADGIVFTDVQCVHACGSEAPNGKKWLGYAAMCKRGSDGHHFLFKWARSEKKFAMWVYKSSDGADWQCCTDEDGPLLKEHDSNIVIWDETTGQFVNYQITALASEKPYPDNKNALRVMALRTSRDGISWSPEVGAEENIEPVTNGRPVICPDENDPEDLEFYRFFVFRQDNRYVGMQLNYAASPGYGNTHWRKERYRRPGQDFGHAPMLSGEWWVSDDGFRWRRPFRHVFACGEADSIIRHEPMRIGQDLVWADGKKVYALPRERLFCVRSLANAAFTTHPFEAPASAVALNAEFGFDGNVRRGMRGQGYIMVEVQEADGQVVEGFDRDGCIIHDLDTPSRQVEYDHNGGALLTWNGKPLSALAGRPVRLRFHFRDARIYDVRY